MARLLVVSLFLGSAAFAQDPNAVSPRDIEKAIRKGTDFLKAAPFAPERTHPCANDLILLTLIHAEVPETNPVFQQYLKNCVDAPLEKTYNVGLLAMCLEEMDPTGYQQKLAQCAQFLVDNQAKNGQWSYGRATDVKKYPFVEREKRVATPIKADPKARDFSGSTLGPKKKPANAILITQSRQTGEGGDNSNSQYASLGLRACHDANITLPMEVLHLGRKWWIESQSVDETEAKAGKNAVGTGGETTAVKGWNYTDASADGAKAPYHAMTAGAVGAVVIYDYMLGKDWKKDPVANAGVNWLGKKFAVNSNLYYMYALERAGMLYGTDKFGDHDWYLKGAQHIVRTQKADGSWGANAEEEKNTVQTCFAILFLKKATRAIATGDRR